MCATGRFGANHIPAVMKSIETLGIVQARKWQVSSLNQFRKALGLEPYKSFEEINPDPEVAGTLKGLYGDINHVELYPGMTVERAQDVGIALGLSSC